MRKLLTLAAAFAILPLAGCAALTSSTNTVARALEQISDATLQSTDATSGGTEAEYADARRYVKSQFYLVRRDAAAGGGEHTAALARLMGAQDAAAFGAWLQDNYAVLFTGLTAKSELVSRIATRRTPA